MRRFASVLGIVLLVGCSSSGGSGGPDQGPQPCVTSSECQVPTPLCVDSFCVACTDTAHCPAERPFCLDGACWGGDCTDDGNCQDRICNRGICEACKSNAQCGTNRVCRADGTCGLCTDDAQCAAGLTCRPNGLCGVPDLLPDVLIVLDHSGSMKICAQGVAGPDGASCDSDGNGSLDTDGASRWDLIRGAFENPSWLAEDQKLGLIVAGIGGEDPACQEATVLVPVGSSLASFSTAFSNPAMLVPEGGTPTAAALSLAAAQTPSSADMRVVLITDGLANCNYDHAMPCTCANENGCVSENHEDSIPFLESGHFLDGRFCLDDTAAVEAVQRLRAAGTRTAIISVGATADHLAPMSGVATAGGLPSDHATGIHEAGDSAGLIQALQKILLEE